MQNLVHFLITFGYVFAIPIMIVEGPIATMVMAALAARGFFNITAVFFLGFFADLLSDYIYYQIGKSGAPRLINYFNRRFNEEMTGNLRTRFAEHGGKIIFISKILPGVTIPVFITAGLAKYPLKKLYESAVPAGLLWTGGLTVLGYYFGKHITSVERLLSKTGIILSVLVILFILYQYVFGKKLVNSALAKLADKVK